MECIATEWSGQHRVQELHTVDLIIAVEYSVVGLEWSVNPYAQQKKMQARHENSSFNQAYVSLQSSISVGQST